MPRPFGSEAGALQQNLMRAWTAGHCLSRASLRANMSETGLVLLINEQKGEKEEIRDEREFSGCCSFTVVTVAGAGRPSRPQLEVTESKAGCKMPSLGIRYKRRRARNAREKAPQEE